ncbi:MAG: PA2169 family four-helix-bundle protein [Terracidiphilus sp.]|nr:PA2169 family four-helix-bundle protein [Terracidiphilus sp.]
MAESKELAEVNGALRSVIDVLHDSHQGLLQIGEHLKKETTKLYILSESQVRDEYAAELENTLHRHGQRDVNEGGTASGTLHRVWGDIKAYLGADDHSLLATAEQGEDEAVKAYEKALEAVLPGDIRDLLVTQKTHIAHSHSKVRDLRDGIAA